MTSNLYLTVEPGAGALERLSAALSAGPVEAVLVGAGANGRADIVQARQLIEVAQAKGCAALIERDARLARTLKADGVHLPFSTDIEEHYAEVRGILGSAMIVGASVVDFRHDAMSLAEAGADYIAFALPDAAADDSSPRDVQLSMVQWWAEIFEVPCVAMEVDTVETAVRLASAGADFIGLRLHSGETPAAAAERVRATSASLAALRLRPSPVTERS